MTIDKAIEIKRKYQYILQNTFLPEFIEADDLSIEALKGIKKVRKTFRPYVEALLPGETES